MNKCRLAIVYFAIKNYVDVFKYQLINHHKIAVEIVKYWIVQIHLPVYQQSKYMKMLGQIATIYHKYRLH